LPVTANKGLENEESLGASRSASARKGTKQKAAYSREGESGLDASNRMEVKNFRDSCDLNKLRIARSLSPFKDNPCTRRDHYGLG
jgi:hypothetical protein